MLAAGADAGLADNDRLLPAHVAGEHGAAARRFRLWWWGVAVAAESLTACPASHRAR